MTNFNIIPVAAIAIVAAALTVMIDHHGHLEIRAGEARLQEQTKQLAVLSVEQERLSDLVAYRPANDNSAELARLRSEAAMLKKQTNDLGRTNSKEP